MIYIPFLGAAQPEPPASIATLLLHFDGANNSTMFVDSSANAFSMTAFGDAKISTADFVAGGASGAFDGTGDRVQSPASSILKITGDFTVEGWVKWVTLSGGIVFNLADNSIQQIFIAAGGFNQVISSAGSGPHNSAVTGVWKHIAMSKAGTTWRLFIDGVLSAQSSFSFSHTNNAVAYFAGVPSYGHTNCFLDDWRFTNGTCLYTASFTPPTPPLT